MSLLIDASQVSAVLIGNEWQWVKPGSFTLDAYEFAEKEADDPMVLHRGATAACLRPG